MICQSALHDLVKIKKKKKKKKKRFTFIFLSYLRLILIQCRFELINENTFVTIH